MSLPLALQAAAIYAVALLLSRGGGGSSRRAVLVSATALVLALPLLGLTLPRWPTPVDGPAALLDVAGALQEPASDGPVATATSTASTIAILPWLWAVGFAVAAARLAADLLAVRRLRASAFDRVGDVALSEGVQVPVVVGVLRPVILLPTASAEWTPARRELVLVHERTHLRGHDNLWLLLARIAACVHWFDPLAWAAVSALRDATDHHADDTVVDGGADPAEYAHTLVELARGHAPRAALAMAAPSGLERRVRALLGAPLRSGRADTAARAGLVAALAVGTATAAPAPRSAVVPATLGASLEAEADRLVAAYDPEGVALIVMDVHTGAVLGRADRGGLTDRQVAPGSVLKPFAVVAALEAGVPADTAFADGDMASILERSVNTGAVEIATRAGRPALDDLLSRVGLPALGALPVDGVALGQLRATPLQVASAWTHLAGHGAIASPIAAETREMLVRVVEGEQGTGKKAAVPGQHVAGKTGTAPLVLADGTPDPDRYLSSFVGLVPADDPALVILVSVAGPHGDPVWGGEVAAPAFRRIVEGL